jgi:hypothetical protein
MITRATRGAVLIALAALTLTGCGRQVAQDPLAGLDLLATGPDQTTLTTPPPHVTAAMDATGGVAAWTQAKRLTFEAVISAYQPEGGFYLTEHKFDMCPWGNAVQVSAQEPQTGLTCRIMDGQYSLLNGQGKADTSPLSAWYRDYAEAVFLITTAPVRMLDSNTTLLRKPMPVMLSGAWYYPIEAKFEAKQIVSKGLGRDKITVIQPYWTQGVYYQNQNGSRVDIIWLGNPTTQKFLIVRGYNYAPIVKDGVLVPTKVEVFQSDAEAVQGQRLALIDLKR